MCEGNTIRNLERRTVRGREVSRVPSFQTNGCARSREEMLGTSSHSQVNSQVRTCFIAESDFGTENGHARILRRAEELLNRSIHGRFAASGVDSRENPVKPWRMEGNPLLFFDHFDSSGIQALRLHHADCPHEQECQQHDRR